MIRTCWSVKGGSGTSVVAASLAIVLARSVSSSSRPVLLIDLAGDAHAVLGLPSPSGPGLAEWGVSGAAPDAIEHLAVEACPSLAVIGHGDGPTPDGPRFDELVAHLSARESAVVVDAGSMGPPPAALGDAGTSVLVIRPCYLALRKVSMLGHRADRVVLVDEPGRALRRVDVESVTGSPVSAHLEIDPAIARAVDAGLLASRLPLQLATGLRRVA
jgi:hypothetical protein